MLTWVEIKKTAIEHNINQYRKLAGKKITLMPVIKANAYGADMFLLSKILQNNKEIDKICVVNLNEAVELIKTKIKKPLMILSFYELDKTKATTAIKANTVFPLYLVEQAIFLDKIGKNLNKKVKVHIKIDTGAGRIGILPNDVLNFYKQIQNLKNLEIEGVFSHFASSESDFNYTVKQYNLFNQALNVLKNNGCDPKIKHMACSAASVVHNYTHFNTIRLGVGMYGLHPAPNTKDKITLKPAISWYTKIVQVKQVPKGSKIGYGGTYITTKPTKLAILPVGYFDGYDRKLSNQAFVEIKGVRCPVRGRICMNLTIVDVSKIKNIKVGDKVTLIGEKVTADELAQKIDTINYEVVDRINPLIPRIVV